MIPYLLTWGLLALPAQGASRGFRGVALPGLLLAFTLLIGLRLEVDVAGHDGGHRRIH